MLLAVSGQHERAKNGQPGGPAGQPALRAVKVLKYDKDPGDMPETLSTEVAKEELSALLDEFAEDGVVALDRFPEIAARARSSMVPRTSAHDSNYKMKEVKEFSLDDIEKAAA
jgi:hypothetical protein